VQKNQVQETSEEQDAFGVGKPVFHCSCSPSDRGTHSPLSQARPEQRMNILGDVEIEIHVIDVGVLPNLHAVTLFSGNLMDDGVHESASSPEMLPKKRNSVP